MNEDTKEYINKIENNLRFVITISIFFLSIFDDNSVKFIGSLIIVGYLITYLALNIRSKQLMVKHLKCINKIILAGIFSYSIPLTILAISTQNYQTNYLGEITWKSMMTGSFYAIFFAPLITLIMTWVLYDDKFILFKKK